MCFGLGYVSKVRLLASGPRFAYRTNIGTILLRYWFLLLHERRFVNGFCLSVYENSNKLSIRLCSVTSRILSWVELRVDASTASHNPQTRLQCASPTIYGLSYFQSIENRFPIINWHSCYPGVGQKSIDNDFWAGIFRISIEILPD